MSRRIEWLRVLIVLLALTAACGGGKANPAAPSPQPAMAAGFGNTAVQPSAQCFQFAGDPACFSGARGGARGVISAAAAPTAPSGLTATSVGSTVTLTWLAPTGTDPATSYVIEAGSGPGLANLANFSTGSSATTFSAGGVPAGSYYVRIRASNSSGVSAASNEVLLVVGSSGPGPCTAAPGAPSGLTIAANSGGTVVLTWTGASGSPTTYIVEAGSTSGASNLANSDLGGTATSLTATGVGVGTYYVRIRAKNACGASGPSNEVVLVVGTSSSGVTGRWIGLVANGDGATSTPNECGIERWDWQLDLTQTGSTVTGTLTQTTVVSGCDPAGRVKVAPLSGTVGSGTLSLTSTTTPVLTLSATFTASRMTGTALCGGGACGSNAFAVNRQ